jgi:hypothetical protein
METAPTQWQPFDRSGAFYSAGRCNTDGRAVWKPHLRNGNRLTAAALSIAPGAAIRMDVRYGNRTYDNGNPCACSGESNG